VRFFLKVNIPVETGNAAARAGTLGETIQAIVADLKPEAAYFTDDQGERTGLLFFEMQDSAQVPAVCEPWFLAFDAHVELHPAMTPDDLARTGDAIAEAARKYG
jgi:hypothetical protein